MQNSTTELVMPSQALNVAFELPDAVVETCAAEEDSALMTGVIYGLPITDFGLLLPIESGSQVLDSCDITPLPHTQDWLLGMANLNGLIAPVYDLYTILGIDHADPAHRRFMVLGKGDAVVGFAIYCIPRLVYFNRMDICDYPPLPKPLRQSVSQCFKEDIFWLTWDFEKFFSGLQVST